MSNPIDLRSDTITTPTLAMRQAMVEAEVGDDVYGEDPTVNRLEEMAAELLGKEAAVYVSSGTQGNLISVLSHCGRGDEMILGDKSHIFIAEQGGSAALGGIHPHTLRNHDDGTLDLAEVEEAIRGDNPHYPITKLLCLENTQNFCGGRVLPIDYMDAAGDLAHAHGLRLHVDGARIWNAAVALNTTPARLLQNADTASVCLSKGLSAPVGSIVVGSAEFIAQARRMRKVAGGAMRQAGMIAAAGIVALTDMIERLSDDHDNAQTLAHALTEIDGIHVEPNDVETNLVFFDLTREDMTPAELSGALHARNVLINPSGGRRLRAAMNRHITADEVQVTLVAIRDILENGVGETNGAAAQAYG